MTTTTTPSISVLTLDGTTGEDREVLGGKAFSIEQMRALGIPVPQAFVLTTEVCRRYYADGRQLPADVWAQIPDAMARLEETTGRGFGDPRRPLLISVRSGAATSMPGMMDTILNLGMTDDIVRALAEQSGDAAYASDTRRRFLEQFERVTGVAAPVDPWEQLRQAVVAVLESWHSTRAIAFRRDRGLSDTGGTAVTVQAMVFGNLDEASGTGVLFTRNPLSGTPEPYGEWLPRGQGEDVVSGRADALPLDSLATTMPDVHADLMLAARRLEEQGRDVQDIEFTVESGRLWLLQTRSAKRTPEAVVRHAVQLQHEGLISVEEALERIDVQDVEALQTPHLDPTAVAAGRTAASGKPACPGIASGVVVSDADEAEERAARGESVILARPTTDPDDVAAMSVVAAVLTEFGGSTSHAAVVCREMGVPCIVGCGPDTVTTLVGKTVTVCATTGAVYEGRLPIISSSEREDPDLAQVSDWVRGEAEAEWTGTLSELLRQRAAARNRDGRCMS
ncbi:pyruvate, phosphate dikinase [Nocardia sp. NPDC059239]|uniref:pyruvate, phosphate dikinase n=1 Tax=unclassified Nocardia TaxID=2637762 RepID=UPI0036BC1FBB